MSNSKLIELSYFDPKAEVRLKTYADTIVLDKSDPAKPLITAIRFGGYPESVRAMSDAIYAGATIDASHNGLSLRMNCLVKSYDRQMGHDGIYATATLMARDDAQNATDQDDADDGQELSESASQSRNCYIFYKAGDRDRLFEELDRKTAVPMIPAFRDYVLDTLIARKCLRQLEVISLKQEMDAWVLSLEADESNIVAVLEAGLRSGAIQIPGSSSAAADGFDGVDSVTSYLNTFGVTVADRIRNQFTPLFDPATQPLSDEILSVNHYIQEHAGYSLYDAQLAVAEATKRQLDRKGTALIIAECGSGKTKIGSTALGALHGMWASQRKAKKSFGLIMCPSHITQKWVREIGETLPDTYAMVVRSITDLNRLYALYLQGDKSVYAVFSKEKARDGYMTYPAVTWNERKKGYLCPHCMEPIQREFSDDGTKYLINADQFFFLKQSKENHKCPCCGEVLWAPVNPSQQTAWVKIGGYGWVYRHKAKEHLQKTKNGEVLDRLNDIIQHPDLPHPTRGACRRFPLSTYIKKKMRGKIDALLCDELHEYNNASGQGDAMAELYGTAKLFVGMTATLINGYSSGIFHLLYRIVPGLMKKDGKLYQKPMVFDSEYGVVESTYELSDAAYNANRRASKRKTRTRQLPGVSPLVYSRFLLEYTSFLSLTDMGKDLPSYEEIPIPLQMPEDVADEYRENERILRGVLQTDKKIAKKILSAYLNLLTVYPDQPYDQPAVLNPITGEPIAEPKDVRSFEDILPKEREVLNLVRDKATSGEKVLIYTSWTRTDSQKKLTELLRREGYQTAVLSTSISPDKREAWVDKQLRSGLQVLITNPRCVETGLDLNDFTTLIFYSMGYNLFTLRQASRRSWRINQRAPKVEVYMLYYTDTMQAKAMKLMASKLAVAGIIEGSLSDEGLAAMSDVQDMTSQMAKELAQGIKDNVEDIAAAFKKMAVINPSKKQESISVPVQQESSAVPEPCPAVPIPAAQSRTMDSQARQKLYEDLLKKSEDERKRRKKKVVIDEDQFTLFDPAA